MMPDQRALSILQDLYWSRAGWRPDESRRVRADDFAYAKSKGVMFDARRFIHDEVVAELVDVIARLDRRRVADAFLASLSTRRLDWRSALGSLAVFQHLAIHQADPFERHCQCCGLFLDPSQEVDLNVLNFQRFKWGGVRHDRVEYALLDLSLFLKEDTQDPIHADVELFKRIVAAISSAPATVTSATLHERFSSIIKSNKAERDVIVAILGFTGILSVPQHPGYSDAFVPTRRRVTPSRRFVDMRYPACWWTADLGIDDGKLREYFGHVL